MSPKAGVIERIRDTLQPVAEQQGVDLEEMVLTPAGRRRVLRIAIDADDGVNLDTVASVTKAISTALDETDLLGQQQYTLEVTSRGVDAELIEARHWRRNVGRLVKATAASGAEHETQVEGRIVGATDSNVTLDTADGAAEWPIADLSKARVQVEFNRAKKKKE